MARARKPAEPKRAKPNVIDVMERVSGMGGRKEDDETTRTLKQQRRQYERVLREKGWRVGKVYKLLDQSGFDVLSKIGDEVVERVAAGKSRGLLVGFGDRLTRNWWEGGAFLTAMAGEDADLIDAQDPELDYRTDNGRTVWGMKMVANEIPSLSAKRKGRELADELLALGIPNRVRYGYRRNERLVALDGGEVAAIKTDPNRPAKASVPDEETAPIVRRIFDERDAARSWASIADGLNDDGIPAPNGGAWTTTSLSDIIASDVYIGVLRSGEREPNPDAHEPLVSRAQWRRVQTTETVARNGKLVAGIAGGLLVCSTCERPLSVIGGSRTNYACRRRSATGRCARPVHVTKAIADDYIEEIVVALLDAGDVIELVASARDLAAAKKAWQDSIERRKGWSRFADAMNEEDWREGNTERIEAEKKAQAHYEALRERAEEAEDFPEDSTAWRLLDTERQRQIARQLIGRVIVAPPISRSKYATVEDRFEVYDISGAKLATGFDWA